MSDDQPQPPQNPFAAPKPSNRLGGHDLRTGQPGRGYVNQIPILAIMTIVHGVLLSLMGIMFAGYGILIASMLAMEAINLPPNPKPLQIIAVTAISIGVPVIIIAIMQIVAGIRNLKYRGRIFTLATWLLGLLASFTCYCGPTSVGLAIWGMIVFLNPAVAAAFKMAEQGMDKRDIPNQFY